MMKNFKISTRLYLSRRPIALGGLHRCTAVYKLYESHDSHGHAERKAKLRAMHSTNSVIAMLQTFP
jgi:hypothetical protein